MVEQSEVNSTVGDDTGDGNSDTVVKAANTGRGDGLLQAVEKAIELLLASPDIGCEASTGVVEGVDDAEGTGTGETTSGHVDGEELSELGVLVRLGEGSLDGVLEGEVERLGREVPEDVGGVSRARRHRFPARRRRG